MAKSGPPATATRRPAIRRPGGPLVTSQAARMNLFVLVRILFQYLERVDRPMLILAKEVLKDCERKHASGDSKYKTLANAIGERLRDAVGEAHWARAKRIQRQLAVNRQKKKTNAMQTRRRESRRPPLPSPEKVSQERLPSPQQRQASEEALEAVKAMSALSHQASPAPLTSKPSSAPKSVDRQTENDRDDVPAQIPILGGQSGRTINENGPASILRQGLGGAAGLSLAGRPPSRRKSPTFAPVPSPSLSPAGTSSPATFSTGHN